jgi:hypothetical protein
MGEYFEKDINLEDESYLPPGIMDLRYQRQATTNAKKIIETHGGVFKADVVGMGIRLSQQCFYSNCKGIC